MPLLSNEYSLYTHLRPFASFDEVSRSEDVASIKTSNIISMKSNLVSLHRVHVRIASLERKKQWDFLTLPFG